MHSLENILLLLSIKYQPFYYLLLPWTQVRKKYVSLGHKTINNLISLIVTVI